MSTLHSSILPRLLTSTCGNSLLHGRPSIARSKDLSVRTFKMSATPMDLGPANPRISPLIKLSRWSLLVAGIFWGMHRYNVLKQREDDNRDYIARMQPIWDAENAQRMAKENREQLLYLAKETGVKVPREDHEKLHDELLKECMLCK